MNKQSKDNYDLDSIEFKEEYFKKNLPKKVLFFIHTPKTAGTLLRKEWLLKNIDNYYWYGSKQVGNGKINPKTNYITASMYHMIGGHVGIEFFLKLETVQPRVFLNVVREPISRILSFYNFVKFKNRLHPLHNIVKDKTLFELLESKNRFKDVISKTQIRYITTKNSKLFSDRDIFILGRQDKIDEFVTEVNRVMNFKYNLNSSIANSGGDYITNLTNEANFQNTIKLLKELTKEERELYDSIDSLKTFRKKDFIQLCSKYKK